jgi:hypothetical protein
MTAHFLDDAIFHASLIQPFHKGYFQWMRPLC